MKEHTFTLPIMLKGLNGSDGLIRQHWRNAAPIKEQLALLIMAARIPKFKGAVEIIYRCYRVQLMDWDNHCASFKYLGDALVKQGIIEDDKPAVVVRFLPEQVKVLARVRERTEVVIRSIG